MTDKQIINEIDISKCEFCYSGEYCHIYSGTADFKWMCKENEDCQIKNLLLQLKAKEQECDELKKYEYHYLDKFLKLKDCLTEIKEICNKTVCDYLQCSLNYNHSKDFECEKTSCNRAKRRKFILQILQKISEVEDEIQKR